jgi:hypothetical protein
VRKIILALAYVLVATSVAFADAGFNPGTVISNVYERLAAYGCAPGFGFSPASCNFSRRQPGHRHVRADDGQVSQKSPRP